MSLQSTDQIADLITRIRNAVMVGKNEILVPTSKLKTQVVDVLAKNGYVVGFEVIEGITKDRGQESISHRASARLFYKIMSLSTGMDMSKASDFKLMDKKVVEALLNMPERNTFFRAMSSWIGFKSTSVEFDVRERGAGRSKWSTESLIRYAVNNIAAYSSLPMQMVTGAGVFSLLLTLVLGVQTIVRYFTGHAVEGFTTVILLILILGSIVMISLGIIGYYISQIYEEVKARPRYIISKRIGY